MKGEKWKLAQLGPDQERALRHLEEKLDLVLLAYRPHAHDAGTEFGAELADRSFGRPGVDPEL